MRRRHTGGNARTRAIALEVAEQVYGAPVSPHAADEFCDFATRFLAAIAEKSEPVAWITGGDCYENGHIDAVAWRTGEFTIPLFTHPAIEPAPQPHGHYKDQLIDELDNRTAPQEQKPQTTISESASPAKPAPVCAAHLFREIYEVWAGSEGIPMPRTAPEAYLLGLLEQMVDLAKQGMAETKGAASLPEEVLEILERLRGENTWFSNHILGTEAADLIERLARQVPEGCVVVPREPTEAMLEATAKIALRRLQHMGERNKGIMHGLTENYKAMIAAGEVKS